MLLVYMFKKMCSEIKAYFPKWMLRIINSLAMLAIVIIANNVIQHFTHSKFLQFVENFINLISNKMPLDIHLTVVIFCATIILAITNYRTVQVMFVLLILLIVSGVMVEWMI